MDIEKKLSKGISFADLSNGDVFIYEDDVYMVVDKDYGLGDGRSYDGYAVLLETGDIYSFGYNDICIKVSAKLTITD